MVGLQLRDHKDKREVLEFLTGRLGFPFLDSTDLKRNKDLVDGGGLNLSRGFGEYLSGGDRREENVPYQGIIPLRFWDFLNAEMICTSK